MTKGEFIGVVTKLVKEQGVKVNQEVVGKIFDVAETVVDEAILNGDHVSIMGVKYSRKIQKGRTGTVNVGSKLGQSYKTEDKHVPTVKFAPKKKKALTVEI